MLLWQQYLHIRCHLLYGNKEASLPKTMLLVLESDGPNVNKTVWNRVNEAMLEIDRPGLLDIGTCNLHIYYNAFVKGLDKYANNVTNLVIDLHQWFKLWTAREEDYTVIQNDLGLADHKFLSLKPAVDRIIEQWKGLVKYIIMEFPKKASDTTQNERYVIIQNHLTNKETLIQLRFVSSVATNSANFCHSFKEQNHWFTTSYMTSLYRY